MDDLIGALNASLEKNSADVAEQLDANRRDFVAGLGSLESESLAKIADLQQEKGIFTNFAN